jgi:predicted nucleic acid-binding protein
MKPSVYIETSVVSYLTARPSRNIVVAGHQAATQDFWQKLAEFEVFISELVVEEAGRGDEVAAESRLRALEDFDFLDIDADSKALAKTLVSDGAIPAEYAEDALHIAVTAVHGIQSIVTWNFKHINNPVTRALIRSSISKQGFTCPEICSPDEFLGEDND